MGLWQLSETSCGVRAPADAGGIPELGPDRGSAVGDRGSGPGDHVLIAWQQDWSALLARGSPAQVDVVDGLVAFSAGRRQP